MVTTVLCNQITGESIHVHTLFECYHRRACIINGVLHNCFYNTHTVGRRRRRNEKQGFLPDLSSFLMQKECQYT